MTNLSMLASVFTLLCLGSYCTYTKTIRDSSLYLPIFLCSSLIYSVLWVVATKPMKMQEIVAYSLILDVFLVIAYNLGPMILNHKGLNWQVWASSILIVVGMFWMKAATHE